MQGDHGALTQRGLVGQVKNTFISVHIPSTPSGAAVQQPMASAPAMVQRASLQDSLAAAAAADRPDSGEDSFAFGEVVASPSNRVMQGRVRPIALSESPPGMAVIPESPSAAAGLRVYHNNVSSSVPPTPQMCYSALTTPTGTPLAQQRTTLGLGQMIQSPTADAKAQMMHSAYQQVYMQAPTVTQAPAQYFVPPQQFQVQQPPPIGQYVVHQAMPAGQAFTQPAAAPTDQPPVQTVQGGSPQQSAAAVQLGLVPQQQQLTMPAPSQMSAGVMPAPPQHAATFQQVTHRTVITLPPGAPLGGLPPPPMAAPQFAAAPAMTAAPLTMAHVAAPPPPPPPMAAPQIAIMSPKGMPAPAGIAMQTPQGLSPTMMPSTPDSDMKVLVDMAVLSGNQAAVDALMRQAQSQGIAPEYFVAMVEAAQSPLGSR